MLGHNATLLQQQHALQHHPPHSSQSGPLAPLGASLAGPVVCAALFFLLTAASLLHLRRYRYRPALRMALACVIRGVALTFRAKSVAVHGLYVVEGVIYRFFLGAGFGVAVSLELLPLSGWFGNTAPGANLTPSGKPWRTATMALLPVVIVFGPVEGLAAALEMYVGREANREMLGYRLREASTAGLLGVLGLLLIAASSATIAAAIRAGLRRPSGRLAPHAAILFSLPGVLLLGWAAAYRLVALTTNTELQSNETLFFTLQMLPELLQALLYLVRPTPRIHFSTNFAEWWEIVSRGPGHHAKDSSVQYEDTCFGHALNTLADWLPAERPTDAASRQLPQQSWFDDSDDFGYPGFSGHCETALASQSRWGAGGAGSHSYPGLVRSTTPVPQVWGAEVEAGLPLPTIAECRESVAGSDTVRSAQQYKLASESLGSQRARDEWEGGGGMLHLRSY